MGNNKTCRGKWTPKILNKLAPWPQAFGYLLILLGWLFTSHFRPLDSWQGSIIFFNTILIIIAFYYFVTSTRNPMRLLPATAGQTQLNCIRKQPNLPLLLTACVSDPTEGKGNVSPEKQPSASLGVLSSQNPNATQPANTSIQESSSAVEDSPDRLEIINQIVQSLTGLAPFRDVQSVCRTVLHHPSLQDLFLFDTAEICLWNKESETLVTTLRLPEALTPPRPERTYQLSEGYTGWIAAGCQSLLIGDTHHYTEVKPKVGLSNFPFRSYMGACLKSGTNLLGTIELAASQIEAYQEQDLKILEIIAGQISIAIENVRLFNLTSQQLEARLGELTGLQRVSSELNSTLDLDKILGIVLEEAMRVTQADFGEVYFYEATSDSLVAYKKQGGPEEKDRDGEFFPSLRSPKTGITGRAFRTGQSILVPDVREDEEFIDRGKDIRSKVVVPVYYGGEPVGVINLESRQLDSFNPDQLRYLEALANHAAVAIGNAQAYQQQRVEREQASRRADQLSRLSEISSAFRTNRRLYDVLEDIVYAIAESVGYDVVLISLVRGNPPMIHHEVGAGIPLVQLEALQNASQARPLTNLPGIMREEFRISNSYLIPAEYRDVWQTELNIPFIEKNYPASPLSYLARQPLWQPGDLLLAPLADFNGTVIGLLAVENPVENQRPSLPQLQTLETFANYAAAAIENAQLFEREKQRRHLADTLRSVAEDISSQLEFDDLLNIVLQKLASVVEFDSANVQLLQENQLVIIGGHSAEGSQKIIGLSFPMSGNNPNRLVVETQEPFIVKDVHVQYPASFSGSLHSRIRSWLGVPLTYGTNVLGLIALDKYEADFFTREDAEVVLAFANQVAVALQNAELFQEARTQVRQLAALNEVAQSINRALELNDVLNLVLDAVFDLVGHQQGSIWLIDRATNTIKIANTHNIPDFLVELFNESSITVNSEPFVSVIRSGQVLVVEGRPEKDRIANYGLPFPSDVTYVPLKTEGGVIGIFAIEAVIHNKNLLELVVTLANLAAVAIDSARLLEDTRRQATEMQHLYNLGVEVSGMLEVDEVMKSVIGSALTLMHGQVGAILFWDDDVNEHLLEEAAISGEKAALMGLSDFELVVGEANRQNRLSLWVDLTRQIVEAGQPVIINFDSQWVTTTKLPLESEEITKKLHLRSLLAIPIQIQSQINGIIFVATLTARYFTPRDIQSLSFVANQAAVAIRNAQLVQRLNLLTTELEQRVAQRTEELAQTLQHLTEERDRVGTLYQIARELSASFDLDLILNDALGLINRAIGISLGAVLLLDYETGHLVYRAALGSDTPLPRGGIQTKYRLGYGLSGRVMEDRTPRLIADLRLDSDWVPSEAELEHRSALAVPLSTGDDVLGVLMLFHPEPNYFSEDQLKLVTAAGAQVATAVNNAELYRLITDQAERLGVMYRIQAAEAAKNQAILIGITDGVLVLDAKRNIVLVNPMACEILHLEAAALENQPLQQILANPASAVESELTRLLYENLTRSLNDLEAGQPSSEFRIEVESKAVTATLAPVALGAEERPSVVAVLRDISREAEIDRLKNEFISTVSHELRTPMTSIKGYADLLLAGNAKVGELTPRQRRFVEIIQSNANRLTELVNDILEISRIETGRVKLEFAALDIAEVIREVALSFEGQMVKKSMNLSFHLPKNLPPVYADKARLTQVLVNLIGNAWQYTPEGGSIEVSAKVTDGFVQIDVADTGIGIVEKDIEYVFDRFFRSERTEVQVVDGTGLGLSITRSFVEMLGGRIWVASQIDVGTTFSFTLPIDQDKIDVPLEEPDLAARPQLLLINHDEDVVKLLIPGLERRGYQVRRLNGEKEALKFARSSGKMLRFILADVSTQDIDLFEFLSQLEGAENETDLPLVMISSLSANQNGLVLHLIDCISTSFENALILKKVSLALNMIKEWGLQTKPLPVNRPGRILIVEQDRTTSNWLKDILASSGYGVQCAFNSQQALDMAFGDKPGLIMVNAQMPGVEANSLISELRHSSFTRSVPLILVTGKPIPAGQDKGIKIFGRETWSKGGQSVSVETLTAEIPQVEIVLS